MDEERALWAAAAPLPPSPQLAAASFGDAGTGDSCRAEHRTPRRRTQRSRQPLRRERNAYELSSGLSCGHSCTFALGTWSLAAPVASENWKFWHNGGGGGGDGADIWRALALGIVRE